MDICNFFLGPALLTPWDRELGKVPQDLVLSVFSSLDDSGQCSGTSAIQKKASHLPSMLIFFWDHPRGGFQGQQSKFTTGEPQGGTAALRP